MSKYAIYLTNQIEPLIVEADTYELTFDNDLRYDFLKLKKDDENIAGFNWFNISGFKKLEDN